MSDDEEEEAEFDDGSLYSAASQSEEEDEESELVSLADSDESSPLGKRRLGKSKNSNAAKKPAKGKTISRRTIAPKRSQMVLSDDDSSDRASPVGIAIANKPSITAPDSSHKKVKIAPPEQVSK